MRSSQFSNYLFCKKLYINKAGKDFDVAHQLLFILQAVQILYGVTAFARKF